MTIKSRVAVVGRRNCTRCTRWRHLLDFPPRKNRRGEVTSIHGECHSCRRRRNREQSEQQKVRNRVSAKVHQRRKRREAGIPERSARSVRMQRVGSVRREPFAAWLRGKIKLHNIAYVSMRTGINERQIWAITRGYDPSGGKHARHHRKRKARVVDYITFDLVDKALSRWDGDDPNLLNEMYPPGSVIFPVPNEKPRPPRQIKLQDGSVPDLIGEYRARRRARKPRSG